MRDIAYRRCSTSDEKQSVGRQLMNMTFDLEFTEYASGKNEENRHEFQKMLSILEKGDHVWFQEISRAGRNTSQLLATVHKLISRGVTIHFVTESLVFTDDPENPMQAAISKMLLSMLSAVNEMQLAQLSVAVKQGMVKAIASGKSIGAASPNYGKNSTGGNPNRNRKAEAIKRTKGSAERIKIILETVDNKLTYTKLSDILTRQNIPLPSGSIGKWSGSQVKRVCDNHGINIYK